jgi:hypothetical protein
MTTIPYELVDAEEASRKHPNVYEIPSLSERKNLPSGCFAQVRFAYIDSQNNPRQARQFIEVKETEGDGKTYYGEVVGRSPEGLNLPMRTPIQFEVRHVFGIVK